jgi:membrane peptidoglycan carboxypeptidase
MPLRTSGPHRPRPGAPGTGAPGRGGSGRGGAGRGGADRDGGFAHQMTVMLAVSALTGVLLAGMAMPFVGLLGYGAHESEDLVLDELPLQLDTEPSPERTRILTRSGATLATLYDQNRVELESLDQVAPVMRQAIVAIEDSRFFRHGALDLQGTLRALIANTSSGGVVQGGSSITQQLVKMTLIEQADTQAEMLAAVDDTYARKVRELRYALGVEEDHTKREILLAYLNIAYFGDGAYGIEAAAQHFFGISADELNARQSAMLAGLVQNPTRFDPTNSARLALERRNVVLETMGRLGVITPRRADALQRRRLGLDVHETGNGCLSSKADFFCDYVQNWLLTQPALGETRDDRERLLLAGGLTVRTTLDMRYQRATQRAVRQQVNPRNNVLGGLAMVEPGTGEVRALAQSRPMGNDVQQGETFVNYMVPPEYTNSAGIQPGSTFKAFVLAAAIRQGIPLDTSIYAPPTITVDQDDYEKKTCPRRNLAGTYTVSNSTESGTMDLYSGTQESVNTFYVQLEQRTGLCAPWKLANRMGIGLDDSWQVPSFTLGVSGVSPVAMAEAYATFAARGRHCEAIPVTRVTDRNGHPLAIDDGGCQQVLKPAVADAVNDVLKGVTAPGGFAGDFSLNQPDAGKTGTTQDARSVWFMGYTPNLVTAAMVAGVNDLGEPQSLIGKVMGDEILYEPSGSGTAAPMWYDAMRIVQQWLPNKAFTIPNARIIKGREVTVPPTGGMDPEAAQRRLQRIGLRAVIERDYHVDSEYSFGTVAYTSPGSYSTASSGDLVTIYLSDGTPYVPPAPEPEPAPAPAPDDDGGDGGDFGGGFGGGDFGGGGDTSGDGGGGGDSSGPGNSDDSSGRGSGNGGD